MKKIKLLAPILGMSGLVVGMVLPTIASCTYDKAYEVKILGDAEIKLSDHMVGKDKKFETDVTWISTKKVVDASNIQIQIGSEKLTSGFEYTADKIGSAKGHLVINEGLIHDEVIITMQLIDDDNQMAKIQAVNVNAGTSGEGLTAMIEEGKDIAWANEDAIVSIYWDDDDTVNADIRYYSYSTDVTILDEYGNASKAIPQASKINPEGFCILDYYEHGLRIKIPGSNITDNRKIKISLDLRQSTSKYYGYNVDSYQARSVQYPAETGPMYDALHSIRLPAVIDDQYVEFSIDLNEWGAGSKIGEDFSGDIYFMIGENVSDTGGTIMNLNSNNLGNLYYGSNVKLNVAVSSTGYITIYEPENGWGKIGNLSRITGWYRFIESHTSIEIMAGQLSK